MLQFFLKTKDFAHFTAEKPSDVWKFFQCHKFENPNPNRLSHPRAWASCWIIAQPLPFLKNLLTDEVFVSFFKKKKLNLDPPNCLSPRWGRI